MKTLILKSDKSEFEKFYIKHMQLEKTETCPIYRVSSGMTWYIAVIWIEKLNLPFKNIFYNVWKKNIKKYDRVIIFDRNLSWDIIRYIKKKNPNIRCIAWYWNPILNAKKNCVPKKYNNLCEKWSFDQNDCDLYGYKKNVQFYFKNIKTECMKNEMAAFFVGVDKGRYQCVSEIISILEEYGYSAFKGIIKDKNSNKDEEFIEPLDYEDIIHLIKKSTCIIDVPQKNQEGITLRVLESLFWEKKLITTNPKIKEYDFYDENNILVWDNPTKKEISDFFRNKYRKINDEILNKYSFEGWLANFNQK